MMNRRQPSGAVVCLRASFAAAALFTAMGANAAAITVNSLADDVFVNAAGATFSDATYTTPVAPAYCTLRMALAAANLDVAVGGCSAGSGSDTITISPTGTIVVSQVAMEPVGAFSGTKTWLLYAAGNVTINGPGRDQLIINGGGLSAGAAGMRTLLVSNNDAAVDAPTTISNLTFREGRAIGSIAASGGSAGACVFSRESLTVSSVAFINCEAGGVGNGTSNFSTTGGAFAGGAAVSTDARPNFIFTDVQFTGNRTVHGTAAAASTSAGGAAGFGNNVNLFVGNVTLTNVQFVGNSSENSGAMRISGGINALLTNVSFISNSASTGTDGAFNISNMSGSVTLAGGGAIGNTAPRRGAGQIATVGSSLTGPVVQISDWSFVGNAALSQDIGGLSILTDTFDANGNCQFAQLRGVNLTNVYFERNIASQSRGGLRIGCAADVALDGVDFEFNEVGGNATASSGGQSAALIHDVANLTLNKVRIVGNRTYAGTTTGGYGVFTVLGAPSSSAVPSSWPLGHSVTATGMVVKDNWAERNEGGLTLRANGAGRNYVVTDAAFIGNRAQEQSALLLDATGNYTVRNSTFSLNEANGNFGTTVAVNAHAAAGTNSINFLNNTIARNIAGIGGDGAQFSVGAWVPGSAATPTPSANVSLVNNILGAAAGGTLTGNMIFAPNTAGYNYAVSNTLFESASIPNNFCSGAGVKCGVDAKLDTLAFNGGSMANSYTHRLLPGSPALDAGDNAAAAALTLDQRGSGFPRVVNGVVDMGAFESPVLTAALPCKLDMNGDNQVRANQEGLVLLRSMLGFSGAAVVNGTGISESQWDTARNNLNSNCGTSFAP